VVLEEVMEVMAEADRVVEDCLAESLVTEPMEDGSHRLPSQVMCS
jgi:hypothetical protein